MIPIIEQYDSTGKRRRGNPLQTLGRSPIKLGILSDDEKKYRGAIKRYYLRGFLLLILLLTVLSVLFWCSRIAKNNNNNNNTSFDIHSELCSNLHSLNEQPYLKSYITFDSRTPNYTLTPTFTHRPKFTYRLRTDSFQPVVSIIIPFYNGEKDYLMDTLQSVFLQSFQQFEVLIVNDGSTKEESILALKEVEKFKDPRMSVIHHSKNKGLSAVRNTGKEKSQSEYLFYLDSDDMIEPTTIEKCLWLLESYSQVGFTKGYTVGFGEKEYLWSVGFDANEKFLSENLVTATSMIRKSVLTLVGGFDKNNLDGMEDWDFWLKCGDKGVWGKTIPEYFDWYRRRPKNDDEKNWKNFKSDKHGSFQRKLKMKYPKLFSQRVFPSFPSDVQGSFFVNSTPIFNTEINSLIKYKPRLLMILPWLSMGGADKFNLNLIKQLIGRKWGFSKDKGIEFEWEVTIVSTGNSEISWLNEFLRLTPDIFILPNFLQHSDFPRFLCYLVESRRPDLVMISNSELGYQLIPYLRSFCPGPKMVDFNHMEEMNWKNGGYPRYSVAMQNFLDLNIVASNHLKEWMASKGADRSRVYVSPINVDPLEFQRDEEARVLVRQEYGIPNDENHMVILFAARLDQQKQPRVMLNVFKYLAAKNLKFTGLIVGDGVLRREVDDFVVEFELENFVKILGPVYPEYMPLIMSACDIAFLPSKYEGISLSIYESMSMSLAILSADVGGMNELVNDDVGNLIKITDFDEKTQINEYSAELEKLVLNPSRVKSMGKNGRHLIMQRYTTSQMGKNMVTLFCQAMNSKPTQNTEKSLALENAIQAIEFSLTQKRIFSLWKEVDEAREKALLDKEYHLNAEKEKLELQNLKSTLQNLEEEKSTLQQDYLAYQKEMENTWSDLQNAREDIQQFQMDLRLCKKNSEHNRE